MRTVKKIKFMSCSNLYVRYKVSPVLIRTGWNNLYVRILWNIRLALYFSKSNLFKSKNVSQNKKAKLFNLLHYMHETILHETIEFKLKYIEP